MENSQGASGKYDMDEKGRNGSQSGNPTKENTSKEKGHQENVYSSEHKAQGGDSHKGGSSNTGKGSGSHMNDMDGQRMSGQRSSGEKQSDQGTPKNIGRQDQAHGEQTESRDHGSDASKGSPSQSGKRSGSQGADMGSKRGTSDQHSSTGKTK